VRLPAGTDPPAGAITRQPPIQMPEFEETTPQSNPAHSYTPSQDAKPRTRRRSGGFKKDLNPTPTGKIGEVDPAQALRDEKLSGAARSGPATESDAEPERRPERERPRRREERPQRRESPKPEAAEAEAEAAADAPAGSAPRPGPDALAAIQRVEARILSRKAERDARREERGPRKKQAPANPTASESKRPAPAPKPEAKGGLIRSILNLFGLGPKKDAASDSGSERYGSGRSGPGRGPRPEGGRGRGGPKGGGGSDRQRGGRPQGKGGRGGPNRRRGGGPRRQPQGSRSE